MKWLEEMPFIVLIGAAIVMAWLPVEPEPHLVEKLRMFRAGNLTAFIDILDVLWHLLPALLLLCKLILLKRKRSPSSEPM
ncbi:MAG: hypothetical protein JKY87_01695 [Mariprofundus sp.]|nr:hypothetical protein [Mariprofundus sp.]